MFLSDFRQQYPQYDDLSDGELADARVLGVGSGPGLGLLNELDGAQHDTLR
jgi:hypothetical protein